MYIKNPTGQFQKITEISKVLGEKWKEIGEEAKKEWQEKADIDKARYLEEMKTYVAPDADSDDEDVGKSKKKRKATNNHGVTPIPLNWILARELILF